MKKRLLLYFCFAFMLITVAVAVTPSVSAKEESTPVSYGLYILAEDSSMAMAGLSGNKISFEAEDFARAMNLSGVRSITITEVPPTADGELLIGSTVVNAGQTISGSNISLLSYSARAKSTSSSYFKFRAGDAPYEIRCNLYMLDSVNHAPTLSVASDAALKVSTHKNITLYGTLPAYDPDGDELIIEVVSYPKDGILLLADRSTGAYTYTPGTNYTGKDSFTYVARDKYGNYSAGATVNLTVNKRSTSAVYDDMNASPYYNAALSVTEKGIMSGTQVGGVTYFYPEQTVSRGDFLVMAMKAAGILNVSSADKTVFCDDADIPSHTKGYVATAYELGYINGTYRDGELCFLPDEPITRAEAAVIVCNIVDVAIPTVSPSFGDIEEVPAFAATAISSLNYMGALRVENGNISAKDALRRGEAAELLSLIISSENK